jgi:hypothetical protein
MSIIVCHSDNEFTLRAIKHELIDWETMQAVNDALHMTFSFLGLPPHLFVTIVPGDTIATEDGGQGWAVYLSGAECVLVAGLKPEGVTMNQSEWIREVQKSVIHECIHYWQEQTGKLDGSQANEDEADRIADEVVKRIIPR